MTVATYELNHATPIERTLAAVAPIRELIEILWWTDVVPLSYKQDRNGRFSDDKVKALMLGSALLGNSMGVDPFRAWANIHPTGQGRLSIAADFKVGLVTAAGHRIETVQRDAEGCTVRGQRKGSDQWVELTLTIKDAERAGWSRNPLYDKIPGDMLYHRTSGRMADMIAPDVTLGIVTYEDYSDPTVTEAAPRDARDLGTRQRREIEAQAGDVIRPGIVDRLLSERSEAPPATPTQRVITEGSIEDAVRVAQRLREGRSAEKLGVGDDPEAGEPEAWAAAQPVGDGSLRLGQEWADTVQAEAEDEGEPMITDALWQSINTLFRHAHKIPAEDNAGREARKRVIEHVIQREIGHRSELTFIEGEAVRAALMAMPPGEVGAIAWPNTTADTAPNEEPPGW